MNTNKILSQYAAVTKDDVVLDAGCGVGGSSIWLAKNIGCTVTGISLSAGQVKQANAFASKEGVAHLANFEQRDYTNTGFAGQSFDVIWGVESVCYVPDKSAFIREAFRLLKEGGRVVVADFFRASELPAKATTQVKRWANGWAVEDFATRKEFEKQLAEAGLSNINVKNASHAIMPSAKRLYRAYFLGIIPAFLYGLFNPKATKLAKNNVITARLQYETLKKNYWFYGIVTAEK